MTILFFRNAQINKKKYRWLGDSENKKRAGQNSVITCERFDNKEVG